MKPIEAFEDAWKRSEYLLDLYDLLYTKRLRKTRADWKKNFRELMHWPGKKPVMRIDGKDAILVVTNEEKWTMDHFKHDRLSELLCAALSATVSSMDRYFHELVVDNVLTLLTREGEETPKALAKFKIPLKTAENIARKALEAKKKTKKAQLRSILKDNFRDELHKVTFQAFDEINDAFSFLGLKDTWKTVAGQIQCQPKDIKERLGSIVDRRNKIVHEANIIRGKKPRKPKRHQMTYNDTEEDINWIRSLVETIDNVVKQELS